MKFATSLSKSLSWCCLTSPKCGNKSNIVRARNIINTSYTAIKFLVQNDLSISHTWLTDALVWVRSKIVDIVASELKWKDRTKPLLAQWVTLIKFYLLFYWVQSTKIEDDEFFSQISEKRIAHPRLNHSMKLMVFSFLFNHGSYLWLLFFPWFFDIVLNVHSHCFFICLLSFDVLKINILFAFTLNRSFVQVKVSEISPTVTNAFPPPKNSN